MKTVTYISILFFFIGLSSCVPDVVHPDQQRVYPSYELKYNKSQNKTTAQSSFSLDSLNGDDLSLTSPAAIFYDDEELIFNPSENVYLKEFIGSKEGNFTYTDLDDNSYTNEVVMVDSIVLVQLPSTHSIALDLILPIQTTPTAIDEQIELDFNHLISGQSVTVYAESVTTGNVLIESEFLAAIGSGEIEIVVRRVKTKTHLDQSTTAGSQMRIAYETQDTLVLF